LKGINTSLNQTVYGVQVPSFSGVGAGDAEDAAAPSKIFWANLVELGDKIKVKFGQI